MCVSVFQNSRQSSARINNIKKIENDLVRDSQREVKRQNNKYEYIAVYTSREIVP